MHIPCIPVHIRPRTRLPSCRASTMHLPRLPRQLSSVIGGCTMQVCALSPSSQHAHIGSALVRAWLTVCVLFAGMCWQRRRDQAHPDVRQPDAAWRGCCKWLQLMRADRRTERCPGARALVATLGDVEGNRVGGCHGGCRGFRGRLLLL